MFENHAIKKLKLDNHQNAEELMVNEMPNEVEIEDNSAEISIIDEEDNDSNRSGFISDPEFSNASPTPDSSRSSTSRQENNGDCSQMQQNLSSVSELVVHPNITSSDVLDNLPIVSVNNVISSHQVIVPSENSLLNTSQYNSINRTENNENNNPISSSNFAPVIFCGTTASINTSEPIFVFSRQNTHLNSSVASIFNTFRFSSSGDTNNNKENEDPLSIYNESSITSISSSLNNQNIISSTDTNSSLTSPSSTSIHILSLSNSTLTNEQTMDNSTSSFLVGSSEVNMNERSTNSNLENACNSSNNASMTDLTDNFLSKECLVTGQNQIIPDESKVESDIAQTNQQILSNMSEINETSNPTVITSLSEIGGATNNAPTNVIYTNSGLRVSDTISEITTKSIVNDNPFSLSNTLIFHNRTANSSENSDINSINLPNSVPINSSQLCNDKNSTDKNSNLVLPTSISESDATINPEAAPTTTNSLSLLKDIINSSEEKFIQKELESEHQSQSNIADMSGAKANDAHNACSSEEKSTGDKGLPILLLIVNKINNHFCYLITCQIV